MPCSFASCHPNAYCINRPYAAKCVCKYGFSGNGKSYCDECGVKYSQENVKIVGGVPAKQHSWPSAALVLAKYKTIVHIDNSSFITGVGYSCGGTLIDRKFILTAGHCISKSFDYYYNNTNYEVNVDSNFFYPNVANMFTVYLGAQNFIEEDIDISTARPYSVKKVYLHEKFDDATMQNDIALLELSEPADLDQNVQISCLPDPKWSPFYPPANSSSWIIGWGAEYEDGFVAEQMNNVRITIYDINACANVTDASNSYVNQTQICAGDLDGGKDTCQGDSGGSMFAKDKVNGKEKFITVGIVSFGIGCARPNLPG
jgi:secreted trypsin-like serine protease